MDENLDKVLGWLLADRTRVEAFKKDFSVVADQFPKLDTKTMDVLKTIQTKGLEVSNFNEAYEVVGQKSYGWEDGGGQR